MFLVEFESWMIIVAVVFMALLLCLGPIVDWLEELCQLDSRERSGDDNRND